MIALIAPNSHHAVRSAAQPPAQRRGQRRLRRMNQEPLPLPRKEPRPVRMFYSLLQVKQLLGPRLVCLQAHRCNPQSKIIIDSE